MDNMSQINNILNNISDKYLSKGLVDAKLIKNIDIKDNKVTLDLSMPYPCLSYHKELENNIKNALAKNNYLLEACNIITKIIVRQVQPNVKNISNVKNIIAVASGKGGVGKSTVSTNIALALQKEGAKVGILDADIYGPSQPRLLGVSNQKPEPAANDRMYPVTGHGIQSMSIGFLIEEDTPMVWRGPMVIQALDQIINKTVWQDIDYMIIDMPPGTGDTQLSISQKIPVTGAVIVTTPQDIALIDAKKGLKMFEKVSIPILGIVENMSFHICSNCNHKEHIFGENGGYKMANDYNVDLLGKLPLQTEICKDADNGKPTVVNNPNGESSNIYKDIAIKVAAKIALKDSNKSFPEIVIQ